MLIDKALVDDNAVSCHYCSRGTKHKVNSVMEYPYAYVYTFKGEKGSVTSAICVACLEELHGKIIAMEPKSGRAPNGRSKSAQKLKPTSSSQIGR